jgi:hypothetical protein
MVETIAPVVRGGRRSRWLGDLALHVAGAALSGVALGAVLGWVGLILGAPWGPAGAVAVAAVAVLYLAREVVGLPVPVLDARRQVPQWWREAFSPGTTAFLYGAGLGVGFATHLGHGTLVAVAAAVMAGGDPVAGAVAFGAFGVSRSLAVGVTWAARDREGARVLTRLLERLAVGSLPRVANGVALAAMGAGAVWVAASSLPRSAGAGVVPALILAVAFGWAAAGKVLRPAGWRATVDRHELPPALRTAGVALVPAAETTVPVLIVAGWIHIAAALSLGLLLVFTVAILRLRSRIGDRVPCGCFGRSRTRSVRILVARNLGLAVVAAAALTGPNRFAGFRPPTATELIPAGLAAVGVVAIALLLARATAMFREARRPASG